MRSEPILVRPSRSNLSHPRSDAYGWRATARICGGLAALVVLSPVIAVDVSPWALFLVAPCLGARIYKTTILLHDCAHGSLFATRRANRLVGRFAASLSGIEFKTFARLHTAHHRRYGRPGDPQGMDYLGLEQASRGRLLWHLLNPLTGYGLVKLDGLRANGALGRGDWRHHLIWLAVVQGMIAVVITAGGRLWWMLPFYPACAATFGLFCSRVRGFCEHAAPPGVAAAGFVRSHARHPIEALFFYDLNFNHHVEHHLHPTVPSRDLPALQAALRGRGDARLVISPSLTRTVLERLGAAPWRHRNAPGEALGKRMSS
jgi:fatty acid desaturase